jgi:DNA-binding CsgD family transcriptional regulator/tetratricopeptide (TPR) repeat protein
MTQPFVGRGEELATLRAALAEARSGQAQLILLEGRQGIGKTTLLDRFVDGEHNVHVLRATGEQWESFVSFGVIDQIMRTAGMDGTNILSGRQRLLPFEEPVNIGSLLLELWGDLDSKSPIVTIIDDAQWADIDSLRALLFALRRMVTERVLVILVIRSEDATRLPEGLRRIAEGPAGRVLPVGPLGVASVQALADALGVGEFSARIAERLQVHTEGNPLYLHSLLDEVPSATWRSWEPVLPAPRAFGAQVGRRLAALPAPARRLTEAAAVLGRASELRVAAILTGIPDPLVAADAATAAELLLQSDHDSVLRVAFPHPLVRAAVYEQLTSARRAELHAAAAVLLSDENLAEALQHRVLATPGTDDQLVAELEHFAHAESARGAWASAASALVTASHRCAQRRKREQLMLRAVDAMVASGDLVRAYSFADDVMALPPGALRDSTLGYLAVLSGHSSEADERLRSAWECVERSNDARLQAAVARQIAGHDGARLRASDMVMWSRRALACAPPEDPIRIEASATLSIGLGWLGRTSEGLAIYQSTSSKSSEPSTSSEMRTSPAGGLALTMASGWLRLATDDLAGARGQLAEAAAAAFRAGAVRVAGYAYSWLSRTHYYLGAWDQAVIDADRALTLLADAGHDSLRPLAEWNATLVPAARGDWRTVERHVRLASALGNEYELMVATAGLAQAQLAAARGEHEAVLRALEPLVAMSTNEAINEPGFWPWQDLYGDALVGINRAEDADEFLRRHEALAEERGRASIIARLARVRGKVQAALGRSDEAEAAFQRSFEQMPALMPFELALVQLTYGQTLRRDGKRRAAAQQLQACYDRFLVLGAQPYVERSERELIACGIAPSEPRQFDAARLTPQELSVSRLVAKGFSNRQIASELMVTVKTVQSHLTRAYAKLEVTSRAQLAARYRENSPT